MKAGLKLGSTCFPSEPCCLQVPTQGFSSPLVATLPTYAKARLDHDLRGVRCPTGSGPKALRIRCNYASGRDVLVPVMCDGTQARASYRCPLLPRCASWDAEPGAWNHSGLTPLDALASGGLLRCQANRLGTFSATVDPLIESSSLLSSGGEDERGERSSGLLIAGTLEKDTTVETRARPIPHSQFH
jgi:hypothetical protein